MCLGGTPKVKAPTPAAAPESTDPTAIAARDRERKRAKGAYGQQSTILTGGQGAEVTAQQKTILGG